jgi:hypothetical protein
VRFGSSHLRLARHVLQRTTFCYSDRSTGPTDFGTAEHMPLIALAGPTIWTTITQTWEPTVRHAGFGGRRERERDQITWETMLVGLQRMVELGQSWRPIELRAS